MDCPYCDESAPRMSLHSHLVDEHDDEIELDGATCRIKNPEGEDIEATVDTADGDTVDRFSNEVSMLVFDRLLDRLEEGE
jgi:hypothetical protein